MHLGVQFRLVTMCNTQLISLVPRLHAHKKSAWYPPFAHRDHSQKNMDIQYNPPTFENGLCNIHFISVSLKRATKWVRKFAFPMNIRKSESQSSISINNNWRLYITYTKGKTFRVSHKFETLVQFNAVVNMILLLAFNHLHFAKQERQVCEGKPSPLETDKRSIH